MRARSGCAPTRSGRRPLARRGREPEVVVCVAPNPSIDRGFTVERLEPGAIHRPLEQVQVPGGKGLNVARAAAALGAEVHAIALLGGYSGRWIAEGLAAEGIELTAVWAATETRSCLSVADAATDSLTEFYEDASPVAPDEWRAFVDAVQQHAPAGSWATFSGSVPPGAPALGFADLAAGARAAIDSRSGGLEARPALVKVNAEEATELTGLEDPRAAACALRDQAGGDGHAAIVTLGRDGAVLVAPDGLASRGWLDAVGRYSVGSGDAFLGGLVVALERHESWPSALRLALGAGAANAEIPGAGRLDGDRAEALARVAVVESL